LRRSSFQRRYFDQELPQFPKDYGEVRGFLSRYGEMLLTMIKIVLIGAIPFGSFNQ
jgi:hypothetical protein